MVRVLNVAEKPSVAKEVSAVLSANSCSNDSTCAQYNRMHRFSYALPGYGQSEMVFTSVLGHLMDHRFSDPALLQWSACDPAELFDAAVVKGVRDGMDEVKRNLQQQARQCQVLVLWLDCDREGENIATEVAEVCCEANPQLQVRRARFSALTHADLTRACNQLVDIHRGEADAVDARAELDLRSGAAFTRFQTLLLRDSCALPEGQDMISYGPCQFPTLGFIVERWLAIQAFVPQDFWSIKCRVSDPQSETDSATVDFAWQRGSGRVFDRQVGAILLGQCLAVGSGTVIQADGRRKTKWAPVPLATVEFQKRASRFLRISSDEAMNIAEKLYQKGILSYPRTETDQFQESIDLSALVNEQTHNPNGQVAQYASTLLQQNRMRRPRPGGHDDNAHPPIHPTKRPPANLSGNDLKVYDLIARHFLACVSHDAEGEMSQVVLSIASEKFRAHGSMVKQRNYLEIYPWDKWANNTIPTFNAGQAVVPCSLELIKSATQPSGLLTESDLIAMMDRKGIGTDATIASHIETMLKRGYATKDSSQHFHPTDLGRALLDGYDKIQHLTIDLTDPQLRAEMEMDMNRISRGEKTRAEVVNEQRRILGDVFRQCQHGKTTLQQTVFAQFGARPQVDATDWRTVRRQFSVCGQCDELMALKTAPQDGRKKKRAVSCGTCMETHELPPGDHKLEAHDFKCRICNFQVIKVTNASTDKSHYVCPHCFMKPPADFSGESGGMRCFKCAHTDCKLATGSNTGEGAAAAPVRSCTQCRQPMLLKRSPAGLWRLSCNGYPNCKEVVWLPKQATQVQVTPDSCARCGQKLLQLTFKPGSVQPADMSEPPHRHTGCSSCDGVLQGLMGGSQVGYSPSRGGGAGRGAPQANFNGARSFANLANGLSATRAGSTSHRQQQQQQQRGALGQQPMGALNFNGGAKRAPQQQQQQPTKQRRILCKCNASARRKMQDVRGREPRWFYMCGVERCDFFQFET